MKLLLTDELTNKWVNNTLVFLAPLALIYFGYVQLEIMKDGFQYVDLVPNQITIGAMLLYIINVLLDYFKKLKKVEDPIVPVKPAEPIE